MGESLGLEPGLCRTPGYNLGWNSRRLELGLELKLEQHGLESEVYLGGKRNLN